MAVIAWPYTDPAFGVAEFWFGIRSNVEVRTARNFRIRRSVLPGTRFVCRIVLIPSPEGPSGWQPRVEAFVMSLEGQTNSVLLHHMHRPVPAGTMRGSPTISSLVPRGARSMSIVGTSGETLAVGDVIGVPTDAGQQLVELTGVSGTGTVAVTFAGPLGAAAQAGGVIVWNRPESEFILTDSAVMVGYVAGEHPGVALEFVEI